MRAAFREAARGVVTYLNSGTIVSDSEGINVHTVKESALNYVNAVIYLNGDSPDAVANRESLIKYTIK